MKCPFVIKQCTKCNKLLVAYSGNFKKNKGGKWGLYPSCKECDKIYREEHKDKAREYGKTYREENKEKLKEDKKEWYEDNKERVLEMRKEYYEENKEEISEYQKQYREEHKEELDRKSKEYRENNKEEINRRSRERYKKNREENLKKRKKYREENPHVQFNNHNKRKHLEEVRGRGISKEQWKEMFDFFGWCCAYSGKYLGGDNTDRHRTIDHIVALSNEGMNEPWNCVPMLKTYNTSKYTNNMEEWYIQQEFYSEERLQKIYAWCEYAFNKWKPRRKGNKKINKIS